MAKKSAKTSKESKDATRGTASKGAGGKSLVIVESPAKARTISKFLGRDFTVEASIGHIRDLPQGAKEIPAEYRDQAWSRLGVNVDEEFSPLYVIPRDKVAHVKKLRGLMKDAKDLYLATDEDREGEAISWHLNEVLKPRIPVHRLVFHEITKEAITRCAREAARHRCRHWSGRRRRGGFWIVCMAMKFRRCCGGRCGRSFRRARAERGGAADRRSGAAADGVSFGDVLGFVGDICE